MLISHPATGASTGSRREGAASHPEPGTVPRPSQTPLIFVVDDDEPVRAALRMLVRSFGWQARAFASAKEVLEALPQSRPDCLVLDLNMPDMNGVDLQETLNKSGVQVPVVAITGHKDSALIARSRAAGAETVLLKPFQDEALKASVERVLGLSH